LCCLIDWAWNISGCAPREQKELEAVGFRSWQDWSYANWSTNRNASDVELDDSTADLGYVVIKFETAWSPPVRILERLEEMFPDIAFYLPVVAR
jgi:hypothetical protein